MLLNYISISGLELTTHPAIANFYIFAQSISKGASEQVFSPKVVIFPGPMATINWTLVLLFVLLVIGIAIAILRLLLGIIYTSGSQDKQLLPLMEAAKIPSWQVLKQQTGISNDTLWQLRDGNLGEIKFSQLSQISQSLNIPLGKLLCQFSLPVEDPQVPQQAEKIQQLETQLQTLITENQQLQQQITNLKTTENNLEKTATTP